MWINGYWTNKILYKELIHKGKQSKSGLGTRENKRMQSKKIVHALKKTGNCPYMKKRRVASAQNQEDGRPIKIWNKVVGSNMCKNEEEHRIIPARG